MVDPFGGKTVSPQAISELNARKKVSAQNDWFATRTVWAKIVSRSEGCTTYKELSSLKDAVPYEGGKYNGNRPNPIITSIKVGTTGNLGTIREATVNLIAFTKAQLDELESCYLIPKMSVLVMFGWNRSASGEVPSSASTGNTDQRAICDVKRMWPAGDGLQGRVGKYDITFNKDGMWWEITLKLVAASNAVMAAPAEDFTNTCECETVTAPAAGESEGEEKKIQMSGFKQIFNNLCEYASKEDTDSILSFGNQIGAPGSTWYKILNQKDRYKTSLVEDIVGAYNDLKKGAIELFGGKPGNFNKAVEAYISIDGLVAGWQSRSQSQCNNIPMYGKFNNKNGGLLTLPPPGSILQSSNPHKALFPPEPGYEGSSPSSVWDRGSNGRQGCYVGNILINAIFARQCLEECGKQATFEDFMSRILTGVNDAAGGLWELTIVDVGSCDDDFPTYSIIDIQNVGPAKETSIDLDPTQAVVREIGLSLRMTDAMQTQALYGGLKNGVKDQACSDKQFTKFLKNYKNTADPASCNPPEAPKCADNASIGCTDTPKENGTHSFPKKLKEMQADTEDTQLFESAYTEQVKMNQGPSTTQAPQQCDFMILPYEFTFTVDGLGGFEFGQMITSNALPEASKALFKYQITGVEHDITHGDWKTTVKSYPRYK